MDIKTSQVINPGSGADNLPDAVKIEIFGVVATFNRHSGIVTIDGAEHVTAVEGKNNTLEIHVCPDLSVAPGGSPFAGIGEEIAPGIRVGTLADLLGGLDGFSMPGWKGGYPGFPRSGGLGNRT